MNAPFTIAEVVRAATAVRDGKPTNIDAINYGLRGLEKDSRVTVEQAAAKIYRDFLSGELQERLAA